MMAFTVMWSSGLTFAFTGARQVTSRYGNRAPSGRPVQSAGPVDRGSLTLPPERALSTPQKNPALPTKFYPLRAETLGAGGNPGAPVGTPLGWWQCHAPVDGGGVRIR